MRGHLCVLGPIIPGVNGVCSEAGTKDGVEDARNVCAFL